MTRYVTTRRIPGRLAAVAALAVLAACAVPGQRSPDPSVAELVERRETALREARADMQAYERTQQQRFAAESRDSQWADAREAQLRQAAARGLPDSRRVAVECRATRCLVELGPGVASQRTDAPAEPPLGVLASLAGAQSCGFYAPAPALETDGEAQRLWLICEGDTPRQPADR